MPGGSDAGLRAAILAQFPTHRSVSFPGGTKGNTDPGNGSSGGSVGSGSGDALRFAIRHFAGAVEYDVGGWVEANHATTPRELIQLLRTSANDCIRGEADDDGAPQAMFSSPNAGGADDGAGGGGPPRSPSHRLPRRPQSRILSSVAKDTKRSLSAVSR